MSLLVVTIVFIVVRRSQSIGIATEQQAVAFEMQGASVQQNLRDIPFVTAIPLVHGHAVAMAPPAVTVPVDIRGGEGIAIGRAVPLPRVYVLPSAGADTL